MKKKFFYFLLGSISVFTLGLVLFIHNYITDKKNDSNIKDSQKELQELIKKNRMKNDSLTAIMMTLVDSIKTKSLVIAKKDSLIKATKESYTVKKTVVLSNVKDSNCLSFVETADSLIATQNEQIGELKSKSSIQDTIIKNKDEQLNIAKLDIRLRDSLNFSMQNNLDREKRRVKKYSIYSTIGGVAVGLIIGILLK